MDIGSDEPLQDENGARLMAERPDDSLQRGAEDESISVLKSHEIPIAQGWDKRKAGNKVESRLKPAMDHYQAEICTGR